METPAHAAGAPEGQNGEVDNPVSRAPASRATHHRKTDRRRTSERPTLTEPIEVKKFFANRKGDIVVIAIRQIEDGPPILDIRKFFTDGSGITRPTKKGLSIAVIRAPDLLDGIGKAVEVARRLGFISGDEP